MVKFSKNVWRTKKNCIKLWLEVIFIKKIITEIDFQHQRREQKSQERLSDIKKAILVINFWISLHNVIAITDVTWSSWSMAWSFHKSEKAARF